MNGVRREVRIGEARLLLGDCRRFLDDLRADLLIFDPPYGQAHISNHMGTTTTATWIRRPICGDEDTGLRDEILEWHGGDYACFCTIKRALPPSRGVLVWDKGPAAGMGDLSFPWKPSWELICISGNGWRGFRDEGVIKGHIAVSRKSMGRTHPTEKPVSLIQHLLSKHDAASVCDPTMGTGATGVAAVADGRPFFGCEIDEGYFNIAVRRIEEAHRQRDLFIHAPVPEPPEPARARDLFREPPE